jgi:hypothetical protein
LEHDVTHSLHGRAATLEKAEKLTVTHAQINDVPIAAKVTTFWTITQSNLLGCQWNICGFKHFSNVLLSPYLCKSSALPRITLFLAFTTCFLASMMETFQESQAPVVVHFFPPSSYWYTQGTTMMSSSLFATCKEYGLAERSTSEGKTEQEMLGLAIVILNDLVSCDNMGLFSNMTGTSFHGLHANHQQRLRFQIHRVTLHPCSRNLRCCHRTGGTRPRVVFQIGRQRRLLATRRPSG